MHLLNVDRHVFVQFKRLVTEWTSESLRSVVCQFVATQGAELGKRFVAQGARMGSQSRVDTLVAGQAPLLWKRLGAFAARKRTTGIQNLVHPLGDLLGQSIHLNPLALADWLSCGEFSLDVLCDGFVDGRRQFHLFNRGFHRCCQAREVLTVVVIRRRMGGGYLTYLPPRLKPSTMKMMKTPKKVYSTNSSVMWFVFSFCCCSSR